MNRFIIFSFLIFYFAVGGTLLARDVPSRRIEDDSRLRISLVNSWFREAPETVINKNPEIHTLRGGGRVQVRVETSPQNREEFAIVLARERYGGFTGWTQGSWALIRRMDNDPQGSRIRVFLRSDFNTFVQFRPFNEERSFMDVLIYDAFVMRSHPIPVPFERLMVLPVENVLAFAGERFPRRYFDPEPGMYRDLRRFVAAVRARLPELSFADDGAIDEHGNFVFINDLSPQPEHRRGLNCSGFAKWVVDGILRPHTGQRLSIDPLKAPFGERGTPFTDAWEELRDPFFGLDWCRNLASRAGTVLRSPTFGRLEEIEVRHSPFSQVIVRQGGRSTIQAYPGFITNAGFGIEGIIPLLYTLAIDEPGHIYLAAVNDEWGAERFVGFDPHNLRGLPRMRQYFHVAVLVPFFTEQGVFQIAVFESAAETSILAFRNRYPGQFVNLSRIPIDGLFDP